MLPNGNVKTEGVSFLRTVIVIVKREGMGKRKKNRKKRNLKKAGAMKAF